MTRAITSASSPRPKRSLSDALSLVTGEITRMLEQGVMPWRAPWDEKLALAATPGLPLRFNGEPYRGANTVLLWASQIARNYERRTWVSYRQALQLGAHVRKGEKATPVIYYGQASRKDESNSSDEAAKRYRFLKIFYVFNLAQLENVPAHLATETAPAAPTPCAIEAWAARAEARIRIGGVSAYYAPATDTIHLPPAVAFESDDARIATLCHELSHHTGAAHRLDRLKDYFADRSARIVEELTAEISSAIICAMIGLKPDHIEDHAAYVSDWLKLTTDSPRAFFAAAAKAQAAVDWLIARAGYPGGDADSSERDTLAADEDLGDDHAAL